MNLTELTERAVQIQQGFATRARRQPGRVWTREEIMQGLVVDVGDLMRLVMAKAGARPVGDVDRKLAHELADCLWSVLILAHGYGVNLETEYLRTMNELEAKFAAP
jgi:NTP pyrophosphatase (non-canonical NTP hydrolase)